MARSWLIRPGRYWESNKEEDVREAVGWFERAGARGDDDAQFYAGYAYESGRGAEKDIWKALEWYKRSAENGNAAAQNNLGLFYCNGTGVKRNFKTAVYWLTKSAARVSASCRQSSYTSSAPLSFRSMN